MSSGRDAVARLISELLWWQRQALRGQRMAETERLGRDLALQFIGSAPRELDRLARDALQRTAGTLGADQCYVAFRDGGHRSWEWYASIRPSRGRVPERLLQLPPETVASAFRAVRSGEAALWPPSDLAARATDVPGVRSLCWMPLVENGIVTGLAGAHARVRTLFWSEERRSLLLAVGRMLAKARGLRPRIS